MHKRNFVAVWSVHTFLRAIFSESCWVRFAAVLTSLVSEHPCLLLPLVTVLLQSLYVCLQLVPRLRLHRNRHRSLIQEATSEMLSKIHIYQFNFKGPGCWYLIITDILDIIHCCSLKKPHNFESRSASIWDMMLYWWVIRSQCLWQCSVTYDSQNIQRDNGNFDPSK